MSRRIAKRTKKYVDEFFFLDVDKTIKQYSTAVKDGPSSTQEQHN